MIIVWSIGYGCVGDMWRHLHEHDVELLVDVRENPWSERPEWCGANVAKRCIKEGLSYEGLKEVGNPFRGGRAGYQWARARTDYARWLEHPKRHQAMLELMGWATKKRTVVMCACRAHDRCHRGVLLERLGDSVTIIKLGEDAPPPKQGRLF